MSLSKKSIDSAAIIEPGAKLGKNVTIEAYAIVKGTVTLEDNVTIKSHAYIDGHTTIGEGTTIFPSASIGTRSQDLKYRGETTFVKIGKHCDIREFVTINSSTGENTSVVVGDHCLVMAYCHIAHNCEIGNRVIMGSYSGLAGHVTIEDHAILAGMIPVHQRVRIGRYSMVGGMSRISHDVPPYTIGAGIPFKFGGLNLVGLKRHRIPLNVRQELSKAFHILYRRNLSFEEAIKRIEAEVSPINEIQNLLHFCRSSKRGLMGIHGGERHVEDIWALAEDEQAEAVLAASGL